jgi:X-Pro dipeptidyl-peptidase
MRSIAVLGVVAMLLVAIPAAPGLANDVKVPPGIETTHGVTKPDYPDLIVEEYRVPTKYGEMYGWVTRPDPAKYPDLYADGQGTFGAGIPTILVLSPYNSLNQPIAGGPHVLPRGEQEYYPPRGYAFAQFDVIGTRESGGCFDYGGIRERKTGAAVVDFLGTRTWSNGKVGMIGGSYDGTTQLAAAVEQPEHLAAIIPQVAIDRWYDYAYGGGIRYFLNSEEPGDEGFDTPIGFDFGFAIIPPTSTDPASGQVLEERINPCDRLEHSQRGYEPDPVYDEFWKMRDYRRLAHRIEAPVFLEGGWLDHNVKHWDTTQMYQALPDDHPKKMVIGQWPHAATQFPDATNLQHAWFDQWLLGFDTGIMDLPAVDTEVGGGKRVQESDWPPPGTKTVDIPLTADAGPRRLGMADADAPTYRDIDPALTEDEALDGQCNGRCLVFLTEPLTSAVRISGALQLRLTATTDDVSTHYTPVVFAEAKDGSRRVISRGFLNTRNRTGLGASEPLEAGKAYVAPVPIWDTDYAVPAGDRIGVAVLSSNAVWAIPEEDSRATNSLTLGGKSWLTLPLSEGAGSLMPRRNDPPLGGNTPTGTGGDGDDGDDSGIAPTGGTLPATGGGPVIPGVLLLAAAWAAQRRRTAS